jgi:hypothetical protein
MSHLRKPKPVINGLEGKDLAAVTGIIPVEASQVELAGDVALEHRSLLRSRHAFLDGSDYLSDFGALGRRHDAEDDVINMRCVYFHESGLLCGL